jgi:hypothetical protein
MHEFEITITHHEFGRENSRNTIIVRALDRADAIKRARRWANDEWGRSRSCEMLPRRFSARRLSAEG